MFRVNNKKLNGEEVTENSLVSMIDKSFALF